MNHGETDIEIILYEDRYAADFKRLNLEWLDKYHLTEELDLQVLNNPKEMVLDPGGIIYLARIGDGIVGTAGLMKEHEGVFELIKMAVSANWQGRGIGRMLIDKCLETARAWKLKQVTLYSNSQLKVALGMYKRYGFRDMPLIDSPLETADVRMALDLDYE